MPNATSSVKRGRTPQTTYSAKRGSSPRRMFINSIRKLSNQKKVELSPLLEKSRNSHNNLLIHLEDKLNRPLDDTEKKTALYFAFQSHGKFHGQNSAERDVNKFYVFDCKNPTQKKIFHMCKEYFAEQAKEFFQNKGWFNAEKKSVADLFSGMDAAFTRHLKSQNTDLKLLAVDASFNSDIQEVQDYKNNLFRDKITPSDKNLLERTFSDKEISFYGKQDFIYMSAPVMPRKDLVPYEIDTNYYNNFLNNILSLSKEGTDIVIGMHINNIYDPVFSKLCERLSNDDRFEYEYEQVAPDSDNLIANQFQSVIHLKVKPDNQKVGTSDQKKLSLGDEPESKKTEKTFSGLKKGFLN